MIRVFDKYGREMFITRQAWRDSVLVDHIKKVWDNPDQLAGTIIQSLQDGFAEDMVKPAEQLQKTDPNHERGAAILAVVYLDLKRLDDAERTLNQFIQTHGERGCVLTNLAKVYSARGDAARSLETLWRGLQLDPNQDNGMGWYEVIHREKGGDAAGHEALRRVAAIPGSWRAQLWLARAELQQRNLPAAMDLYRESLAAAGRPVPVDMLMQISGDLGNQGCLAEILELAEPLFDINQHGLQVGNNLIKAHVDLGHFDAAQRLLDSLYALKRPDWKPNLAFWDTEIQKQRLAAVPPIPLEPKPKGSMYTIAGPIWLPESSSAAELFPAQTEDVPMVAFIGSSAETGHAGKAVERQMADNPGRLSRALPLFLAEQVNFCSQARTMALIPWLEEVGGSAFILCSGPWKDSEAAEHARHDGVKADYVVITHLVTTAEPWRAELRLVRTIDGQCIGTLATTFSSAQLESIPELSRRLRNLLLEQAGIAPQPPPANYQPPPPAQFPNYLLRLEQLLAVRCQNTDASAPKNLSGEHEILDGNLLLCVDAPQNITTRLLLAHTFHYMKKCRPEILPEFTDKIRTLQTENPLPEPAQSIIQRILDKAVAP